MHTTDTLVLGAGPSGLAVGACLRKAGVAFELLERGPSVGTAWRNHYDRLHLHTARAFSALPHRPFPAGAPQFVPRLQVVQYLEDYAREFQLTPVVGADVTRVARGTDWTVTLRDGRTFASKNVVIATGYNRVPFRPTWPGTFDGLLLHSSEYRNGAPFAGQRVLVVGIGNTGGEIALDLLEHGAVPTLAVRSPVVVIPREVLGQPSQATAIRMGRLPIRARDWIGRVISRVTFGDLSRYGLGRPSIGPATMVSRGRIPLIDIGTIGAIKSGAITVTPGLERFDGDAVVFTDGSRRPFDAIVLATGYRPGLHDFLECAPSVTNAAGYPSHWNATAKVPGLYFLGFVNPATGFLREIALEAPRIAAHIAQP